MAYRSITIWASAFGLAALMCPTMAASAPLAMVDPTRPMTTIFDQVLSDRSLDNAQDETALPVELRRQVVAYSTQEAPGTIVIDTPHTFLYYVLGGGRAIRYAIGVGREGFTWAGVQKVSRKAEWPDWTPPAEMIQRQQYLPRWVAGGPGNPLGARAMYLGETQYRIHGTNDPTTIGKKVSSGCVRLTNEDVIDLFGRTNVGTKVVVLPDVSRRMPAEEAAGSGIRPTASRHSVPSASAGDGSRDGGRQDTLASAFGLY
jgi:lipoprotein-anchoring transpeptidase ErfK/SrfK